MPTTVPLLIISGSMGAGRTTVPGARPIVCRLTAPLALMRQRLRVREFGMFQNQARARSTELDDILEGAAIEHFTVDNGPGRLVTDVGHEMLTRAGERGRDGPP